MFDYWLLCWIAASQRAKELAKLQGVKDAEARTPNLFESREGQAVSPFDEVAAHAEAMSRKVLEHLR